MVTRTNGARPMVLVSCQGCGLEVTTRSFNPRKWCSEKCRVKSFYQVESRLVERRRSGRASARKSRCRACGGPCSGRECMSCKSARRSASRYCGCGNSKTAKANVCLVCRRLNVASAEREVVRARRRRASRVRRQRIMAACGPTTTELRRWKRICERDGWRCWLCSESIDRSLIVPHRGAGTADHVVPLARGGADNDQNLRAAHFSCNSRRGARAIGVG